MEQLVKIIGQEQFSLYTLNSGSFSNNGFTGLFILKGLSPVKSSDYLALDWWYRTQSLYFTTPRTQDPSIVIILKDKMYIADLPKEHITKRITYKNIEAILLDNKNGWYKNAE